MQKLTVVHNYRDRLTERINMMRYEPFQWGTHDCALWVCGCVKDMTGKDMSVGMKPYDTPEGAFKILKRFWKADNLRQVFSDRFEEVHIAQARPGDIVIKNSNLYGFNCVAGICYGMHSFFILEGEGGLVELDTLQLDAAFRVF